jgi:hypothetical protein
MSARQAWTDAPGTNQRFVDFTVLPPTFRARWAGEAADKMTTHRKVRQTIVKEFVGGIADMVSITGRHDNRPFPGTHRSDADALRSDWVKLGGDMRKAVSKVSGGKK